MKSANRIWLWLIPVLLLVAALGVRGLNMDYIWIDEYYSVSNAGWLNGAAYNPAQVWESVSIKSSEHAPGYYMLLAGWAALTGWSPFSLRALSLWFGLLGIAFTYQTGRIWISRRAGLYAASVVGVGAFYVYFTHELRMYTLLAMLVALTLWLYGRIVVLRASSPLNWIGFFAGVLGLLYTHYYSAPMLIGLGLYHLIFIPKNRRWLWVTLLMVLALLLFVPWAQVMLRGAVRTAEFDNLRMRVLEPGQIVLRLLHMFSGGHVLLLSLIGVFALVGARTLRRPAVLLWFMLLAALLSTLLINLAVPNISSGRIRYLIFFWPLLALLIGLGLSVVERFSLRAAAGLLLIWLALSLFSVGDRRLLATIAGANANYPPLLRIRDELLPRAYRNDLLISFADEGLVYTPGKFGILGEFYIGTLAADRYLVRLSSERDEVRIREEVLQKIESHATVWFVTEPDMRNGIDLYRRVLEERFTLCDTPVSDDEIRIDRYDLNWLDCQSRLLPQSALAKFGNEIAILGIKLHQQADSQVVVVSAWSVAETVPPETYSVSLRLQPNGPEPAAAKDFGLRSAGQGWYVASVPSDLASGSYRLCIIVYDWKTGQRLTGIAEDFVGEEVPVLEFELPLEGIAANGAQSVR